MPGLESLLDEAARRLRRAGVEAPRREARLLLAHASGIPRERQLAEPGTAVDAAVADAFRELVVRRAAREPLAYILGRAEFWSLDFLVGPGVLVPRPETETLVEVALRRFPDRGRALRLLDIGIGLGCLLLTLLRLFPDARGVGTDTSATARDCAARNAELLGVAGRLDILATSYAEGVDGPFDLVVSNPPYVPSAEIAGLQPEVALFEPRGALDGGRDGLDPYRAILAALPSLLAPDGRALLEIGMGQEGDVAALAEKHGLRVAPHRDLAGIVRCLELRAG